MLIYFYFSLSFGIIYGIGSLYFNIRTNEKIYEFLPESDQLTILLVNGLFILVIYILSIVITGLLFPLIIVEGVYKWIKKSEN